MSKKPKHHEPVPHAAPSGAPAFAQPVYTPDPTQFIVAHPSDNAVRFIALHTNTLEGPGVISSQNGTFPELTDVQLAYMKAALQRVKQENFAGVLILAHHHPAYTAGNKHGWSVDVTSEIDAVCKEVGVWPHAVLSAHAHNYQRFTRANGGRQTPYIVAGGGGHNVTRLTKRGATLRTPMTVQTGDDEVTLENYDDQNYGYLRIVVNAQQLRIEYHPASDGDAQKTPDDSVTVDLATRTLALYTAAPAASANGPSTEGTLSASGAGEAAAPTHPAAAKVSSRMPAGGSHTRVIVRPTW